MPHCVVADFRPNLSSLPACSPIKRSTLIASASNMLHASTMNTVSSTGALRLLQSAEAFRQRLAGEFSAVHGVSVNEFLLLLHLDSATSQRLSRVDLAKRMNLSASTVTRMVAPMEKTGIVRRESDERDARFAFVAITDAGQTKLNEARETFERQAGYFFQDRWAEQEVEELSSLLFRFVASVPGNLT